MRTVAIANQKGGVGKTTTAINLACCLAELGQEVLLIDLDPQASATSGLGMVTPANGSLYLPLLGMDSAKSKILPTRLDGLHLIPADVDLSGAEIEVARMDNHLGKMREVLAPLREEAKYDFCLLDCPPSLGVLMTSGLASADELLIALQCEWFGLAGLAKITDVMRRIRESGVNDELFMEGILMTMYDKRTRLSQDVATEVKNYFPDQQYETIIPRNIRLSEAPSHGLSIIEHDPKSNGALAYRKLAKEFLKRRGLLPTLPPLPTSPKEQLAHQD